MAGTSLAEGGLTLDMSRMRDVTVDLMPGSRMSGPGACSTMSTGRHSRTDWRRRWAFVSKVGVAGLTLGGGLGYLTRRFGWTVDNLKEVEIVTADGEIRTANREQHAELFWALRGGGGNFGVVTRFTFRLHEVGPTITGGLIVWSADRVGDVLATYRDLTESAPRELTAVVIVRPRRRLRSSRRSGTAGPSSGCSCATAARRGGKPRPGPRRCPIADLVTEKPYTDQQSMLDGMEPKGNNYYWKTEYLSGLSKEFLDTFRGVPCR